MGQQKRPTHVLEIPVRQNPYLCGLNASSGVSTVSSVVRMGIYPLRTASSVRLGMVCAWGCTRCTRPRGVRMGMYPLRKASSVRLGIYPLRKASSVRLGMYPLRQAKGCAAGGVPVAF